MSTILSRQRVKPAVKLTLWGGLACILAACGADGSSTQGASAPQAASGAKAALTVQTVRPERAEWVAELQAHGAVAPWQEVIVGAEVGGVRLTDVLVNVGDWVRKGQLLAVLRQDGLLAELAALRAQVAEAQALQVEAQANADRSRTLRDSDAVSAQELQRAQTALQTAQARVEALKAQVSAQELRLAQSRIVAPDDGLVASRAATPGSTAQPGQELFRLIRQGRLEWRAEVPSADLVRIRPGMSVALQGPTGVSVTGHVRAVAPMVDASTRNGVVQVDLPAAATQASGLKAGMFASGRFEVSRSAALHLPQTAVLLKDGFAHVFAVREGVVQQTKVQVGRRQGDRVEVVQGLTANTDVVASGVGFLVDGDPVRVVASPAGSAASAVAR
jgi:RND family efflux transporter MFP subunit